MAVFDLDKGSVIMSIFAETMGKAITDYRLLLRRYLPQSERMAKLRALKLRRSDTDTYASDKALYDVGRALISDMQTNMTRKTQGYYSYSGIQQFCNYLNKYLDNYEIENGHVIHRAQKASRALLACIQLMGLPREQLDETISNKLIEYNAVIVNCGSLEQCELQQQTLLRHQAQNPGFYTRIVAHLESLLLSTGDSIAA